ncbi:Cytochrome C oxidase, cbb3-type, subunit III [Marivirga sericea]|uniref:Cytochrome C oxidase, cbb3-type, subunit III n=1 Tax=Marivirga sericea TaxID=1028 RepID=A0A1X7L6F5_9BACT|nr:c-type cytochrome [Marivirga sericea]SMG48719.1 Cytochrome C oxidase, cbb3-type, subunit III [Marivirga sericea]
MNNAKKYNIKIAIAVALLLSAASFTFLEKQEINSKDNLMEVLYALGQDYPEHYIEKPDSANIKRGYELIHVGKTKSADGIASKAISKFYTCTSCHNVEREDLDLTLVDQDARLEYAMENKLPYLQGSTFWGIVNRESWYNDDYILKYGSLVDDAKNSLKGSIQLCATVCSQGRELEDWEMTSILSYLSTLQMKVEDLELNIAEFEQMNSLAESNPDSAIAFIKSHYLSKSPATFAELPESKEKGYSFEGRPQYGKAIYELGCQHCHHAYGESDLVLDNSVLTFRWLKKHMPDNSKKSIYEIIRKGSYSELGHKEYMPNYTLEKMSHRQVEDLRAYIESNVK